MKKDAEMLLEAAVTKLNQIDEKLDKLSGGQKVLRGLVYSWFRQAEEMERLALSMEEAHEETNTATEG